MVDKSIEEVVEGVCGRTWGISNGESDMRGRSMGTREQRDEGETLLG